LTVALGLAVAGPAPAQGMSNMKGMAMGQPAAKTGQGTGVIKAIDPKAGTLTLQHGPIPGLGWPAMTMPFKADPPSLLKGLKVGQTIGFDVKANGVAAEVTAVRPK
jgi:Cu(I)/Ag(I) efflux system protein CusF